MTVDRRYWDSDCFLGWLNAEEDKQDACREVLQAAEDGKTFLVTSALTIAEVLALRGKEPIPTSKREQVEKFFRSEYIEVRNITRRVAEAARTFVWDYGVKPKDALHVATAIDCRLVLFNTFDKGLRQKSLKIGAPPLLITTPQWAEPKLPMELPRGTPVKT